MKKELVADVKPGTIVRFQGEWGVLEGRYLDRWIGGPIRLKPTDVVEVPKPRTENKDAP